MFGRVLFFYAILLGLFVALVGYWVMVGYVGNHGLFFATGVDHLYHALAVWWPTILVSPLVVAAVLKLYRRACLQATAYVVYSIFVFAVLYAMLPVLFD